MAKTPVKTPGKAIVKWDEEFAKYAEQTTANVKLSSAKFISFGGGKMSFGGADIPGDELRCVVVGWCHANAHYDPDIRYDPKNPQSPLCYAFGTDEKTMEPHSDAPDKQSDICATCPHNEFGTADHGRGAGKACKNGIRLALISEDDLENLEDAELVYASLPTKSIKNWLKYSVDCKKIYGRPHWALVTLMKRVPDDDSQFRVTFKHEELIEDSDLFGPLKDMWERAMGEIDFPYAPTNERTKVAPKGKGKAAAPKPSKFSRR